MSTFVRRAAYVASGSLTVVLLVLSWNHLTIGFRQRSNAWYLAQVRLPGIRLGPIDDRLGVRSTDGATLSDTLGVPRLVVVGQAASPATHDTIRSWQKAWSAVSTHSPRLHLVLIGVDNSTWPEFAYRWPGDGVTHELHHVFNVRRFVYSTGLDGFPASIAVAPNASACVIISKPLSDVPDACVHVLAQRSTADTSVMMLGDQGSYSLLAFESPLATERR